MYNNWKYFLLVLLKYLTPKRQHIYLVICIYFFILVVLHQLLKTLLAQLEPLLDLIEILEEFHCW
jgi:hypothetical protein